MADHHRGTIGRQAAGGVGMELSPDSYRCGVHDVDLTELVREALDERIAVAYRRRRQKGFEVAVTCPGDGTPHLVVASGTVED